MLGGDGSRLFKMHSWNPGTVYWPGPESATTPDLMTPPPFKYKGVPQEVQTDINRFGETYKTWKLLEEFGVDRLEWRQPLKHIELGFWSEDIFATMKELIGDQLHSSQSFTFFRSPGLELGRCYHRFDIKRWPATRRNTDGARQVDWFVPELCEPPLSPDAVLKNNRSAELRRLEASNPMYALPAWLDRGDEKLLFLIDGNIVTEAFVDSWRSTDISKHLQADPWETDFVFEPLNFDYRWVDVPVPEWVEL